MYTCNIVVPPNTSGQLVCPAKENDWSGIVPNGTGNIASAFVWYMKFLSGSKGKLTLYDANSIADLKTIVGVLSPSHESAIINRRCSQGIYVVTEEEYSATISFDIM